MAGASINDRGQDGAGSAWVDHGDDIGEACAEPPRSATVVGKGLDVGARITSCP